jgi:hypothetical protein
VKTTPEANTIEYKPIPIADAPVSATSPIWILLFINPRYAPSKVYLRPKNNAGQPNIISKASLYAELILQLRHIQMRCYGNAEQFGFPEKGRL